MRLSLVVTAVLIAGCQSKSTPDGPPGTDGGAAGEGGSAADGPALDVPSFLEEAQGAQAIPPLTIVFENPSARPLYLVPGCGSEFTISPEAGEFQEYLGHREFCLCECGVCQSPTSCEDRCANAGSKQVPAGGVARLRWIPRSYQREVHATFSCQRLQALAPGKYRLSAVVYDSSSLDVGWTGAPVFGVSKDFELPLAGELRVPLVDPGADGAHCTTLAACCPKLPIPEYTASCKLTVVQGVQPRCRELLEAYRRGSACR